MEARPLPSFLVLLRVTRMVEPPVGVLERVEYEAKGESARVL